MIRSNYHVDMIKKLVSAVYVRMNMSPYVNTTNQKEYGRSCEKLKPNNKRELTERARNESVEKVRIH